MEKKQPLKWLYDEKRWDTPWGARLWRQVFYHFNGNKLPVTYSKRRYICMFDSGKQVELILYPVGKKGNRNHRVFVECPRCSKDVPAGRVHQHKCK